MTVLEAIKHGDVYRIQIENSTGLTKSEVEAELARLQDEGIISIRLGGITLNEE